MKRLGLFEGTGVEIEYMIVDRTSLDVLPVCDRLMASVAGEEVADLERGRVAWSNELALHVLELKTNGPAPSLGGLAGVFHAEVVTANEALAGVPAEGETGGVLLPGGVHPWMDPLRETTLWPHEYNEVYRTFDRIFGCKGHGWSNLQSTHINLPFANDEEFRRLHAAIRVVLPLVPALAASSPFLDGQVQPALDARLEAYRDNARRIPQVAGLVIPEPVESEQEYRDVILQPLYDALSSLDPEGTLRHEWANARGAIARFERGAIEIRVIDAQECPTADFAVVSLVLAVVRALAEERWATIPALLRLRSKSLASVLWDASQWGADAVIRDSGLLSVLGQRRSEMRLGEVWQRLADALAPDLVPGEYGLAVERIVAQGPLGERMLRAFDSGSSIEEIARGLVACLGRNELFLA